jgi:hypothetical protein
MRRIYYFILIILCIGDNIQCSPSPKWASSRLSRGRRNTVDMINIIPANQGIEIASSTLVQPFVVETFTPPITDYFKLTQSIFVDFSIQTPGYIQMVNTVQKFYEQGLRGKGLKNIVSQNLFSSYSDEAKQVLSNPDFADTSIHNTFEEIIDHERINHAIDDINQLYRSTNREILNEQIRNGQVGFSPDAYQLLESANSHIKNAHDYIEKVTAVSESRPVNADWLSKTADDVETMSRVVISELNVATQLKNYAGTLIDLFPSGCH